MRRSLLALSLLCLLTLPLAAHADQIDDFVISGNYDNGTSFTPITFSAQASGVVLVVGPTSPYAEIFVPIFDFYVGAYGSPDVTSFLTSPTASTIFFGGNTGFLINDPGWLTLPGDLGTTNPEYLPYAFHVGTYSTSYYAYLSNATNLTLTITPEAPTPSPIPEPSSLLLVGTGLLSCATLARRKLLCRSATSIK